MGLRSNKYDDQRILEGWWMLLDLEYRHEIVDEDRALKVSNIILSLMRSETGSQCYSFSIGVMWSYFQEQVISRAAVF